MNLFFWRKRNDARPSLDILSWNLMVTATDPDKCWELASQFRKTSVPSNVLDCETSFLMGSVVRDILRDTVSAEAQRQALMSTEAAYYKTFDDQSDEELPPEMKAVYGDVRLGHVARIALAAYEEQGDSLSLAIPLFVRRIKGDPRMAYEIAPLVEHRRTALRDAFRSLLSA